MEKFEDDFLEGKIVLEWEGKIEYVSEIGWKYEKNNEDIFDSINCIFLWTEVWIGLFMGRIYTIRQWGYHNAIYKIFLYSAFYRLLIYEQFLKV